MRCFRLVVLLVLLLLSGSAFAQSCDEQATKQCAELYAGFYKVYSWASPVSQNMDGMQWCGYNHSVTGDFSRIGGLSDFQCCDPPTTYDIVEKVCKNPAPPDDDDNDCEYGKIKSAVDGACTCPDKSYSDQVGACSHNPNDDPCEQQQTACLDACAAGSAYGIDSFACASVDGSVTSGICTCSNSPKPDENGKNCQYGQLAIYDGSGNIMNCAAREMLPEDEGCPANTVYGDFNGQTGCFHNGSDPDSKICDTAGKCAKAEDMKGSDGNKPSDGDGEGNGGYCVGLCSHESDDNSNSDGSGGGGSGAGGSTGGGSGGGTSAGSGADGDGSGDGSGADGDGSGDGSGTGGTGGLSAAASAASLESIDSKMPSGITSEEEENEHDAGTGKAALLEAWESMKGAPIVSAGGDVFGSFPEAEGDCPVLAVDVFDHNIQSALHCELFAEVRPYLSSVMLAFWSIMAVFVFRRM